jgi:hypothetical protein
MIRMRFVTVSLAGLLLAGCASAPPPAPDVRSYRSPSIGAVDRILVLPFIPENDFPDQADMLTARFIQGIRSGTFTVLPLPDASVTTSLVADVRLRGSVRAADLVKLQEDYRVDAVVIGSVTRYDPYAPQVVGLDVKLVSTRSGMILWQARKVFDATEESVHRDALAWYDRYVSETEAEFGPEVVLLSPKAFARYACSRLAESMVGETRVARR